MTSSSGVTKSEDAAEELTASAGACAVVAVVVAVVIGAGVGAVDAKRTPAPLPIERFIGVSCDLVYVFENGLIVFVERRGLARMGEMCTEEENLSN